VDLISFLDMFPRLVGGTIVTVELLSLSFIFGNALAVAIALGRVSRHLWRRRLAQVYIEAIRGTPLLVQIYLLYYGMGSIFAQTPAIKGSFFWPFLREGFWYAVAALTISTGAYSGEILRGAIEAVPLGEVEAAQSLGLSRWQISRHILVPRAVQMSLPALGGETVLLLKSTALASTITVVDVMGAANRIRSETFLVYESLLSAAVVYVLLTFLVTRIFAFLERRINRDRGVFVDGRAAARPG
jgi:polar amino acid transport system permease protein